MNAFKTFGPPELCDVGAMPPGICRFQTTAHLRFARKLSQRSRARLVAWSVEQADTCASVEEPMQPWRAQRLVTRYLTAANEAF